jgi:predicted DNA-binding protein with PD1-like motif
VSDPDILLVKLQPNQDVITGLEAACRQCGVVEAFVISAVGSLNEACLQYRVDGIARLRVITGPGLEVAGATGIISAGPAATSDTAITAWVCDKDGHVVGGQLVRGENIVCVTFEFVLGLWQRAQT